MRQAKHEKMLSGVHAFNKASRYALEFDKTRCGWEPNDFDKNHVLSAMLTRVPGHVGDTAYGK